MIVNMDDQSLTIILVAMGVIISLIGLVYKTLSNKVDEKLDKDLYAQNMLHLEKMVDGINGTAATLKTMALEINKIQNTFLTEKDFQAAMKIHDLECGKKNK